MSETQQDGPDEHQVPAGPSPKGKEVGAPLIGGGPDSTHGSTPKDPSPWKSRAVVTLVIATLLALATDLVSKSVAFRHIADHPVVVSRQLVLEAGPDLRELVPFHEPVVAIPNLLNFTLVLNPGAVFGIGAGARLFFVMFTLLAVPFALWVFGSWTTAKDRGSHIGIGMMLGGGLGNLYDRISLGCVRDFIHPLPGVQWPFGIRMPFGDGREIWPYVSNLADLWLIIGIGLLLVHLWRGGRPRNSGEMVKSTNGQVASAGTLRQAEFGRR